MNAPTPFIVFAALTLLFLHALNLLNRKLHKLMASQADLNSKLDEANAAIVSLAARVAASQPAAIDFAPEVAKVQQVIDGANAIDAAPVAP